MSGYYIIAELTSEKLISHNVKLHASLDILKRVATLQPVGRTCHAVRQVGHHIQHVGDRVERFGFNVLQLPGKRQQRVESRG